MNTTSLSPWTQIVEGGTALNDTFTMTSDTDNCFGINPCIRIVGLSGSKLRQYIEQKLDSSTWSDVSFGIDVTVKSFNEDEYAFFETVCDGDVQTNTFLENQLNEIDYSQCFNRTTPCNELIVRVGAYINGVNDFLWISQIVYKDSSDAPTKSPTLQPTQMPSLSPTPNSGHIIIWGNPNKESVQLPECTSDFETQSIAQNKVGNNDIGVTCCFSETGTDGDRPDCKSALNYFEAEQHCASNNMILCSQQQISTGEVAKGVGCKFSEYQVWTRTPCDNLGLVPTQNPTNPSFGPTSDPTLSPLTVSTIFETTTTNPQKDEEENTGNEMDDLLSANMLQVVGGSAAVLCVLICLCCICCFLCRWRKYKENEKQLTAEMTPKEQKFDAVNQQSPQSPSSSSADVENINVDGINTLHEGDLEIVPDLPVVRRGASEMLYDDGTVKNDTPGATNDNASV